jgi:hypothetical protein
MNKYKFNTKGWFKDSWRHMLAAKGIKTRKYQMPKVSPESIGLQLHSGRRIKKRLIPAEVTNIHRGIGKPGGVLWTSTYTPEGEVESDWQDWAINADFKHDKKGTLLKPKSDARIFQVDTEEDFDYLTKNYPAKTPLLHHTGLHNVDWKAMSKDWDAIRVPKETAMEGHNFHRRLDKQDPFESVYSWDAESTAWLNPQALKIVRQARLDKSKKLSEKILAEDLAEDR